MKTISGVRIVSFCCWAILLPCTILILTDRLDLNTHKIWTLILLFITGIVSALMIPPERKL